MQNDYEVFYHLALSIGGFPHPFNGKRQQKHPVYHNAGRKKGRFCRSNVENSVESVKYF